MKFSEIWHIIGICLLIAAIIVGAAYLGKATKKPKDPRREIEKLEIIK